jgi:DNA-binding MarR family transcriptional regulator
MSEEDRLQILRLTEQVEQLAKHLGGGAGLAVDSAGHIGNATTDIPKGARPPLPDPRLVRRIVRQRQLRARYFDPALFADPAWDILLDLTAARAEHARVSVSSLCIASGVPATTALRWITQMVEAGLLERQEDVTDRRRAFIALSDAAADSMARYFAELGRGAAQLV